MSALATWKKRLAAWRKVRNHWWSKVEKGPRSNHSVAELTKEQKLVAEAFAHVQELMEPSKRAVTMYDAVTVGNIPSDCQAFAGYVAGNEWPNNFAEARKRFPHAKGLTITLTASADADILDVETGGATPADVPGWVKRQWAHGKKYPKVYANASTWPAIESEIKAAQFTPEQHAHIMRWLADYDGVREIPSGYNAKQYESTDYDTSVVEPGFLE